jgi:putative hemolysin
MGISQLNIEDVEVKFTKDAKDIEAVQRLRYKVFYEEYAAKPSPEMEKYRRDMDEFDAIADHLIVIDNSIDDPIDRIVGTYRLLRHEQANRFGRFYTSNEYDIAPLISTGANLLELGRSCVLADYRTRPVMQLLWEGLIVFMQEHDVETMFGCASLHGTDIDAMSEQLAYLYHYHLSPKSFCPRALDSRYVNMNLHPKEEINARQVFKSLPPLIKGYLRVGCTIGEGAVVDEQFDTTDVCIVLPMEELAPRYRKHYARKISLKEQTLRGDDPSEQEALMGRSSA